MLPAAVLTGAVCVASVPLDRRLLCRPGVMAALLGCCLAAIYASVPETGRVPVAAFLLLVAGAAELVVRRHLPVVVTAALVALVLGTGLHGATAQPRALTSALVSMWPLAAPAVASRLAGGVGAPRTAWWFAAGIGALATVGAARTGGIADDAHVTVVSAASWFGASTALAVRAARSLSARPRRRGR